MLENFKMNVVSLKRTIRISIYLPEDYNHCNDRYDVLYMLDGQNAFIDSQATFKCSLKAGDTLDLLEKQHYRNLIMVGIYSPSDHNQRISELCPFDISEEEIIYQPNMAALFADFIVHTLKPQIDAKYRTNEKKESTYIYGSSAGAIMATYLAYEYSNVFSVAGIFSLPAFICFKEFMCFCRSKFDPNVSIYLYVGDLEGPYKDQPDAYPETSNLFYQHLTQFGCKHLQYEHNSLGTHDEKTWGAYFKNFIEFIYSIK